ncbi:MAG TPA: glycosyltransferase [Anaerohalosphaeraceae bacterium]|jgi:glycosyltransferase involved in cell wall biosynthesis|nr:glycosyltransferase [Anaerohalosphaeraceae bacterium]HRT50829.1 glycosyltransferase [Anaerohalosphaeraceae bacterium]HRT86733.1 glycosyltransferase [Anaerohalosphaeraceae bacterium]
MPLVSVVIPTYDRAVTVVEAVNSVLAHSLSDLEVLVVDDGSTDNTESAVRALGDGRVQYMAKANGGPGAARNFGIARATARRVLSHAYRKVAEAKRKAGARASAMSLYRRAIRYCASDLRLYMGLLRALILSPRKDSNPDWQMPEPLGPVG